jgi:hypothetical protein
MLKKKPETSSKHNVKVNSGKEVIRRRSPRDKKKILSVTCKYFIKKIEASSSITRPKRQRSAEISSSNHRENIPRKETTKTP